MRKIKCITFDHEAKNDLPKHIKDRMKKDREEAMKGFESKLEIIDKLFFRDLNHDDNLLDGKTFHAAGIVDKVYNTIENANGNKDLSVTFFEPFKGTITSAWRTYKEVELFEVSEFEYKQLQDALNTF